MRFRASDLRPHGWQPGQTLQIPDWCGCSTGVSSRAVRRRLVALVPVREPDQAPDPLRRWQPAVPYKEEAMLTPRVRTLVYATTLLMMETLPLVATRQAGADPYTFPDQVNPGALA